MITMINSAKRKMKSEGKRIYVKALIITLISLMCSVRAWSQAGVIYPVDINVTLTPPYGTCLTDLTNSDRFRIQALMRDMSHPEYEMVIQMMIRDLSSLSPVFISTTNAFSLTAGEPTKIIGRDVSFASIADFFNFQNIRVGVQYVGTKCLPEGAYLFSFQAFDAKSYRTNRIPISREVTFSAFLEGGEVPILTYPAQNDSICDVQSIHFTWMQPFVSSGVNTYRLQILKSNTDFPLPAKELLDNPNTNDRIEVTTLIPSYTFHDTYNFLEEKTNFLEEKTTYYWRVVLCDADGNARLSYPNKGASEVRSFVYCGEKKTPEPDPDADWVQKKPQVKSIKDNLDVVNLLKAEEDGPDVVRAFCKKDEQEIREKYSGIIVEVKKKSHDTWTPFNIESQSVEDTSVSLGNLAYNELYEARAQYYIDEGESTTYAPYSETIEFTISNPADTIECGSPLPELNSDCTEAPKELKEGDKFSANGANVTILEITSQSVEGNKLKISGTGYVNFPILRNFKLKVKFENAVLNCNLQLEDGTVESVYDLSTAATIDLNNLLGKGAGGYDLPETDPSIVDIPGIDPDNCEECKSYESGTLFSSGGEVYMKDENGAVVSVGKEIDLSTSGEYESNEIRKDNILVWFSNPDPANIAFDNDSMGYYRSIASINDQYTLFATNYITPWVANNPGRVVTLTAKPDDGFTNSGYTGLTFILKTSSTSYVELNNIKNSDGTYNVDIPGTDPSNITHIYAIARPAAGKPYENVGQLKVACYEKKTQKVILVPVANVEPNAETVKSYLTSVYGKLGYSFDVEVDNDKSHVEGINSDQISITSGVFTQYSDEMNSVINTYTGHLGDSYDKSAAYLFLMNKASGDNSSVGGIMPQKHQFGFIFTGGTDVDNRTIAHELGHGLWGLDHTFVKAYKIPEGTTPHLMDYNNGIYLAHFEWSQIDKPVLSWSLMNSDKDNEIHPALKCAISVLAGCAIDAGFEYYSQYQEKDKKEGGIQTDAIIGAALAGIPARLIDCVDVKKGIFSFIKQVFEIYEDVRWKLVKAHIKCKQEERIGFDSYDHCFCEEKCGIFTDQVFGLVVSELNHLFTTSDIAKNKGWDQNKVLQFIFNKFFNIPGNITVDGLSMIASGKIANAICGEREPKVLPPLKPNEKELSTAFDLYIDDNDGLITIYVKSLRDNVNIGSGIEAVWCLENIQYNEFDKEINDGTSYVSNENNAIIIDASNFVSYSSIDGTPHYKVKDNFKESMEPYSLYLVYTNEKTYSEPNTFYVYGEQKCSKVFEKECLFKIKPYCSPIRENSTFTTTNTNYIAKYILANLNGKKDTVSLSENTFCSKGKVKGIDITYDPISNDNETNVLPECPSYSEEEIKELDLPSHAYDVLKTGKDEYKIVTEDKNWKNNYSCVDLDTYISGVRDGMFKSFVVMYALWEWRVACEKGSGIVSNRIKNKLPEIYDKSNDFTRIISRTAMTMDGAYFVTADECVKKFDVKFVNNAINLLPPKVVSHMNQFVSEKADQMREQLTRNCSGQCVFSGIFYDIARELASIKFDESYYDHNNVKQEDLDMQRSLGNYLSILGWKLYCGKNYNTNKDYNGMNIGQDAAGFMDMPFQLTPEGAQAFEYNRIDITTFPDVLMSFLKEKKCK